MKRKIELKSADPTPKKEIEKSIIFINHKANAKVLFKLIKHD